MKRLQGCGFLDREVEECREVFQGDPMVSTKVSA